jgi:hypothetical protein
MKELASWTPRRVIWTCVLWLVGAPVLGAIGLVLGAGALAAFSGKQSIGLSFTISDWSLGWLFVPPIALIALDLVPPESESSP